MKLLKLDARFEDARRVARCLVGSNCFIPRESGQRFCELHGIVSNHYFSVIVGEGSVECPMDENGDSLDIFIRLDQLNFCPHLAAKHQIQVRGLQKGILHFGVIKKIAIAKAGPRFRIDSIEGHTMMFRKSSISINLTPIERGELEGCEIVEVGE